MNKKTFLNGLTFLMLSFGIVGLASAAPNDPLEQNKIRIKSLLADKQFSQLSESQLDSIGGRAVVEEYDKFLMPRSGKPPRAIELTKRYIDLLYTRWFDNLSIWKKSFKRLSYERLRDGVDMVELEVYQADENVERSKLFSVKPLDSGVLRISVNTELAAIDRLTSDELVAIIVAEVAKQVVKDLDAKHDFIEYIEGYEIAALVANTYRDVVFEKPARGRCTYRRPETNWEYLGRIVDDNVYPTPRISKTTQYYFQQEQKGELGFMTWAHGGKNYSNRIPIEGTDFSIGISILSSPEGLAFSSEGSVETEKLKVTYDAPLWLVEPAGVLKKESKSWFHIVVNFGDERILECWSGYPYLSKVPFGNPTWRYTPETNGDFEFMKLPADQY